MMNLAVSKLLWSPAAPNTANRKQGGKQQVMAILSQHHLSHCFMYTFTWTVLGLQSRDDIMELGCFFFFCLLGFCGFLGVFFAFGLVFLGAIKCPRQLCSVAAYAITSVFLSSYTVHQTLRFIEIPFGWKLIMHCFLQLLYRTHCKQQIEISVPLFVFQFLDIAVKKKKKAAKSFKNSVLIQGKEIQFWKHQNNKSSIPGGGKEKSVELQRRKCNKEHLHFDQERPKKLYVLLLKTQTLLYSVPSSISARHFLSALHTEYIT